MKKLLSAVLLVAVVLMGIALYIYVRNASEAETAKTVTPTEATTPATTAVPPATSPSDTNAAPVTTNAAPVDTNSVPGSTNAAPAANAAVIDTNAPSKTAPTPTAPSAIPTGQTVFYQDNFARKGELDSSSPDGKNTGNAKWTVTNGAGSYTANGSGITDGTAGYDAAFLPVNGTTGITLDGKQNFTLSATIAPDPSGNWMGIGLNSASPTAGQNIFDGGLTALIVANGNANAYSGQTNIKYLPFGDAIKAPYVVSMTYHATSGTITYSVGDPIMATQAGITPDKIAALINVSMGNGNSGPTATISSFTLSVGWL